MSIFLDNFRKKKYWENSLREVICLLKWWDNKQVFRSLLSFVIYIIYILCSLGKIWTIYWLFIRKNTWLLFLHFFHNQPTKLKVTQFHKRIVGKWWTVNIENNIEEPHTVANNNALDPHSLCLSKHNYVINLQV